jgi:hypothetical protein
MVSPLLLRTAFVYKLAHNGLGLGEVGEFEKRQPVTGAGLCSKVELITTASYYSVRWC